MLLVEVVQVDILRDDMIKRLDRLASFVLPGFVLIQYDDSTTSIVVLLTVFLLISVCIPMWTLLRSDLVSSLGGFPHEWVLFLSFRFYYSLLTYLVHGS